MATSHDWQREFAANATAPLAIPWHRGAELTAEERSAIGRSLAEFQRGEGAAGRRLLRYAQEHARRTDDGEYVEAIRLFIAEEQRHSGDLGRFLALNAIPALRASLTDRVFRRLRHLGGTLEVALAVLVTAEIIARVYYAALQRATRSVILRALCEQILSDEARHVQFQVEQLGRLRASRGRCGRWVTAALQRLLFCGTVLWIWPVHRSVLRRAGLDFGSYWSSSWREFGRAFGGARPVGAGAFMKRRQVMRMLLLAVPVLGATFVLSCKFEAASPLTRAAASGRTAEVQALLAQATDPNLRDAKGLTALGLAARFGHLETMAALLDAGARPDVTDGRMGWTPLMTAIHKQEAGAARLLLERGADPNVESRGLTALIMAAGYGHTGIVRLLLEHGADPRLHTPNGDSALAAAVSGVPDIDRFTVGSCQTETVRALLEKAPDLRLGDGFHDRMARRVARWSGCAEVVELVGS